MTAPVKWKNEHGFLQALDGQGKAVFWEFPESKEKASLFNELPFLGETYISTAAMCSEQKIEELQSVSVTSSVPSEESARDATPQVADMNLSTGV